MSAFRKLDHPARGRERGAVAVEFALIVPVLLMLVLGIIDFGRLYYTQVTLTQAAREGVRLEALGKTTVVSGTNSAATGLSGLTVMINGTTYASDPNPAVSCPTGTDATVKVTYSNFTFTLAGLVGLGPISLSGTGVMPCGG